MRWSRGCNADDAACSRKRRQDEPINKRNPIPAEKTRAESESHTGSVFHGLQISLQAEEDGYGEHLPLRAVQCMQPERLPGIAFVEPRRIDADMGEEAAPGEKENPVLRQLLQPPRAIRKGYRRKEGSRFSHQKSAEDVPGVQAPFTTRTILLRSTASVGEGAFYPKRTLQNVFGGRKE